MSVSDGETDFRIAELLLSGMTCSDVLMQLALDARGEANLGLVRAVSGLALGAGHGFNCGLLTGGACVIGYALGRGAPDDVPDPRLAAALDDFGGWFHTAMTHRHGGINCSDIMRFDQGRKAAVCTALIGEVWAKVNDALAGQGVDLRDAREPT